jgi:hypothetical protein
LKSAAQLFALNALQYFVVAANMRAIALGLFLPSFITDALIGALGMTIAQRVVAAKSHAERWSYALGGAIGAQLAIYVTKILFGA